MASVIPKKVVIVGDPKVGKTSILDMLKGSPFQDDYCPTVFDTSESRIILEGQNKATKSPIQFDISLHDTSGDSDYDRLRPLSYMDSHLVLLCYAMDSTLSLRSVSSKWVTEINHILPEIPFLLVGNKCDEKSSGNDSSTVSGDPDPQDIQDERSLDIEEEPEHLEKNFDEGSVDDCSENNDELPGSVGGDDVHDNINDEEIEAILGDDSIEAEHDDQEVEGNETKNDECDLAKAKREAMRTKKFSLDARQSSLEDKCVHKRFKKKHSLAAKMDLLSLGQFPQDLSHLDAEHFQPEERKVCSSKGKVLAWSVRADAYVECSAKHGTGLQELKNAMVALLEQGGSKRKWKKLTKMITI
ncbi:rho-related protein racN-like [Tigriopus californicus]|nr:rho-related protein racN-like [Tigriopus californicus]